jgi:hypothetical protein
MWEEGDTNDPNDGVATVRNRLELAEANQQRGARDCTRGESASQVSDAVVVTDRHGHKHHVSAERGARDLADQCRPACVRPAQMRRILKYEDEMRHLAQLHRLLADPDLRRVWSTAQLACARTARRS